MSMYINTGKYLYLLSRYYGDEFSSRIDYLGLFNTLEDAREHAFYHAKAFLDLVGKVSRHTEAITVEEVANGCKIFDANINQFVRAYTFTAVPICIAGDMKMGKDILNYCTNDVKIARENLKTSLQKKDMRDHCAEALKQLSFNSFREASHFWYNDVRGKIKNGIDRFIPVSMVLDMYNSQLGYHYSGTRRWYEEIFGWDRDYLVRAIENMTVIYNDHKAYAVLPMVMTTAEIEGGEE